MIRVLVIDQVRAVRDMEIAALSTEPGLEVRGQSTDLDHFPGQLTWCDLIIINAGAETETSLQLIHTIHRLSESVKIIIVGLVGTHSFLLRCLEAGVNGYLLQDSSFSDLLRTIRAVYGKSDLLFSTQPASFSSNLSDSSPTRTMATYQYCLGSLTRREREVFGFMQRGFTNKEIADVLVVEIGTVKNHVHHVLRKLNINSRRETLRLPQSAGLWPSPLPEAVVYHPQS